jgi:hypothetical protein
MAKAVLNFAIYRDGAMERRESIAQDIVKVGKDPKSHLRVDDEAASRMHAVIEVGGPEDITLIDLGNEPGTLVNGARVNKCKIHVGDKIEIGGTQIVLEAAQGPQEAVQAAPAAPAPRAAANPFGGAPPAQASSNPFAAASNPFAAQQSSNPFAAAAATPFTAAATNPFAHGAAVERRFEVPDDAPPGT